MYLAEDVFNRYIFCRHSDAHLSPFNGATVVVARVPAVAEGDTSVGFATLLRKDEDGALWKHCEIY